MSERLLKVREVAETLGVTPKTVQRWTAERGLPGFRLGRVLRYREGDLEEWLQRHATADGATEDESPPTDAARARHNRPERVTTTVLRPDRSATTEEV